MFRESRLREIVRRVGQVVERIFDNDSQVRSVSARLQRLECGDGFWSQAGVMKRQDVHEVDAGVQVRGSGVWRPENRSCVDLEVRPGSSGAGRGVYAGHVGANRAGEQFRTMRLHW